MAAEPAPDELAAIAALKTLKAQYCRFVDQKQWPRLAALFTPDATLEGFGSVPDGSGPEEFVTAVSERLGPAVSIHHVHTPEFAFAGPDRARGIWPMTDYVEFPAEAAAGREDRGWIGWGYYEEAYVRAGGAWRISFMRLARLRMDALTPEHPALRRGRLAPDPDWI